MIAANLVGEGLGFNVDENALQIFWVVGNQTQGNQILGNQTLEKAPKERLARQLIQVIANCYYEKNSAQENTIQENTTQVH